MIVRNSLTNKIYLSLILLAFCLSACQDDQPKNNRDLLPIHHDVSKIPIDLKITRFDQEIANANVDAIESQLIKWTTDYPRFFPFYSGQIMLFGVWPADSAQMKVQYQGYLQDQATQFVIEHNQKTFPDLSYIEPELKNLMQHFKYYYPNRAVPEFYTYLSFFSSFTARIDTSLIGIELDLYFGKDFSYPDGIPEYLQQHLSKEYIASNVGKELFQMHYPLEPDEKTLLASMIHEGKKLYFLDMMLPDTEDNYKIQYTEDELSWCAANEGLIWDFFIEYELLYSTNKKEALKYINPGPFTSGMPDESPGNIGSWTGWQIVRQYMIAYPETSFEELMQLESQTIIQKSKYRPKIKA